MTARLERADLLTKSRVAIRGSDATVLLLGGPTTMSISLAAQAADLDVPPVRETACRRTECSENVA